MTRRKNEVKAIIYVVAGFMLCMVAAIAAVAMFFSGRFIPVYVAGNYFLGRQIIRYAIYIGLAIVFFLSQKLFMYGYAYLFRKSKQKRYGR